METRRGLGSGLPLSERNLGRDMAKQDNQILFLLSAEFKVMTNQLHCKIDAERKRKHVPSSYLAERNLKSGVTLFPYCGLLRLLHQPLKVRYLFV